jgi:hypothetical protein
MSDWRLLFQPGVGGPELWHLGNTHLQEITPENATMALVNPGRASELGPSPAFRHRENSLGPLRIAQKCNSENCLKIGNGRLLIGCLPSSKREKTGTPYPGVAFATISLFISERPLQPLNSAPTRERRRTRTTFPINSAS